MLSVLYAGINSKRPVKCLTVRAYGKDSTLAANPPRGSIMLNGATVAGSNCIEFDECSHSLRRTIENYFKNPVRNCNTMITNNDRIK